MSILGQQIEGRVGVATRDFAASSYGIFVAKVNANEEFSKDPRNRCNSLLKAIYFKTCAPGGASLDCQANEITINMGRRTLGKAPVRYLPWSWNYY